MGEMKMEWEKKKALIASPIMQLGIMAKAVGHDRAGCLACGIGAGCLFEAEILKLESFMHHETVEREQHHDSAMEKGE